jgi:hypothetical protein
VDAATVVWIAPSGADRPTEDKRALEEWGRARGVHLSAPSSAATPAIAVDLSIGDLVEQALEKARDASSALDADLTEHFLARAESLVRAHPELPESAWLMAEVERGWSARWGRLPPIDADRASSAWRRARGLDGGRRAGLGEVAATASDFEVPFLLSLSGNADARIDGVHVAAGSLLATAGEHQLTLAREGRLVWAGWIGVTEGATVQVAVPSPPACSSEELSKVTIYGGAVRAEGTRCPRWIVAQPGPREGVLYVATCSVDHCGVLLEWSVGGTDTLIPDARPYPGFHWPAWATWTLVGVGAAAIAGTTLALTGVFPEGTIDTPFVSNGLHRMESNVPALGYATKSEAPSRRPR